MDSLAQLLGSLARVKLLRLFAFNRNEICTFDEVVARTKLTPTEARPLLSQFVKAGFLRRAGEGKRISYRVNLRYVHLEPLCAFIRSTTSVAPSDILRRLKKAGTPRLVILSGVFTGVLESNVDLLIVGDRLDERALARAVQVTEAELGREIRYASFSTDDFNYRLGIYDRLIRDIFDYPHQTLLDRIGL